MSETRRVRTALTAAAAVAALAAGAATAAAAPGEIWNLAGQSAGVPEGVRGRGITPGPATLATLWRPTDLARERDGSLLVSDAVHRKVYRIGRDGRIALAAGTGGGGADGDGGPATAARIGFPSGLAALPDGGFLIVDANNAQVRRVSADGVITTIAGVPRPPNTAGGGFSGDGGPATAAELSFPAGVAVTPSGEIIVADTGNGRLRRIDAAGVIHTLAEGLEEPRGLAAEPTGAVLVAERRRVLRVAPGGAVTVVAGGGTTPVGAGGRFAAEVRITPVDVARESNGSILIADRANRVLRLAPDGRVAPPAGLEFPDRLNRDGVSALRAPLSLFTIAVVQVGSGGFAVATGHRVRLVQGRARTPMLVALQPRRAWSARAGGRLRVPYAATRRGRAIVQILRAKPSNEAPVVVGALTLRRATGRVGIGPNAITVRVPPRPGRYWLRLTASRADGEVAVEERPLAVRRAPRR